MPLETIEAPHENPHITPSHSPLADVPLSHPSAFDGLSFIPFRPGADPIPVDLDDDPGASLPTPPESSTATTPPPLTPSSSLLAALSSPSAPSPPADPPEIESTLPPPDPTRLYKCSHPGCHLWFKRAYTRRVHMTTHSGASSAEKRFPCSVAGCEMQFSRKHDRLRHEAGSHGRGTRWRCGACGTHFSTETTLERHRLDRHGI
ncbi:hypothetical protein C8R43DRAFT_160564 [Mycena crocata]|nr:hypothetical protein C8R43DRAFT_160564 [Mycena crocata]